MMDRINTVTDSPYAALEGSNDQSTLLTVGTERDCHDVIRRRCMDLDSQGVRWLVPEGPFVAMWEDAGRQGHIEVVRVDA